MFRALLATAAFALVALPASAGPEAEALIAGAAKQITDPRTGRDAFRDSVDVPTVARFTLGKHARRVSEGERTRFATAFENFLLETFDEHRGKFVDAEVEVIGSKDRNPDDSIVETRIHQKGEDPFTVRWRVIRRDGEWRVVDVEVMGLWLAIEQRAQIAAILDRPRATIEDAIEALS